MIKYFKPYRTIMIQQDGRKDILYSWDITNAIQWVSKAFNSDAVSISKYGKLVAYRSPIKE